MKNLFFIGLLAFGSILNPSAASDVLDTDAADVSRVQQAPLVVDPSELAPVSAQAVLNPSELLAGQSATSVPESAAAGLFALFGYILMLRRRSA